MTDMIERVAKAIALSDLHFDDLVDMYLDTYLDAAKAAIEAMREPTPEMLDRFVSRALQIPVSGDGSLSVYGASQWKTMIDAAIEGK